MKIAVMMLLLAGTIYGQTSNPGGGVGPAGPAGATGATGTQGVIGATGTQGTAGTAGAAGPNGVVNMRGAYAPGTAYALGDGVSYVSTGTTYVNILASTGVLPTVTTNWTPLADAPSAAANAIAAQTTHGLSVPGNCVASGGTSTAYACTTSPTFSPVTGDHIEFSANVNNTGSATLSVNGATAAIMHKVGGSANLVANDLLAGHWVSMTYDGVYWQLEGQLGNAYATTTALTTETTRATNAEALLAPLISPVLAGTPTAPTPTAGDSSLKLANTLYADRTAASANAIKVNGASLPATGDLLITNPAAQPISLRRTAQSFCFGDSFHRGYGMRQPDNNNVCALLARDTPTTWQQWAASGTTISEISKAILLNFVGSATYPSPAYTDGGLNDEISDTCGGTAGTDCTKNIRLHLDAGIAWAAIPDSMRIRASAGTPAGTLAVDTTTVPLFGDGGVGALNGLATRGTAMSLNSNGATLSFAIPTNAIAVGITYGVNNAGTGTATFGINQNGTGAVSQTNYCTGTTTFTNTGCNGKAILHVSTAPFRQEYPLTAGVTHSIVATSTSANPFTIVAVDYIIPIMPANTNPVFVDEIPNSSVFTNSAIYNPEIMAVVAQEAALGLPVFPVKLRTGTPGLNATTDVSSTATIFCYGVTQSAHPTDGINGGAGCGADHMEQTFYQAELDNNWQFSTYNGGGESAARQGTLTSSPRFYATSTGSHTDVSANLNLSQVSPYNVDLFNNGANAIGIGFTLSDSSTGTPWANKIEQYFFCNQSAAFRYFPGGASNPNADTQFTTHAAFDCPTGNLNMDGVIVSKLGTTIATGTGTGLTISPTAQITPISGTGTFTTITPITGMSTTYGGCVKLLPTGAVLWATGGNILVAGGPATVNQMLEACYVGTGWTIK